MTTPDDLDHLRTMLVEGIKRSGQGSYERRAPAEEAVPYLLEVRTGLRAHLVRQPEDSAAWRLLSQAEECLLHYPAAVHALEAALRQSPQRERKDLQRLALLKEYATKWQEVHLDPQALAQLGWYLEQRFAEEPCDHTLRHTKHWLSERRLGNIAKIVAGLRNQGGYCDCEVAANVV